MQRLGSAGILAQFIPPCMNVECQRHPFLGGSGGMQHAHPGRILKLDSLERNFLHSLEWNWLTGKVFKKKKALYLSVNVFSTKVLIGDTIFYVSNWRRDRHFT